MKNEKLRTRLLANTWMNESDMKALSVPYKYEQDTTCIEILEQYAPGQIRYRDVNALVSILDTYRDRLPPVMDYRLDPNRKLIRYDENIDVLMAVAAKHFSAGRNLMESGQQEK